MFLPRPHFGAPLESLWSPSGVPLYPRQQNRLKEDRNIGQICYLSQRFFTKVAAKIQKKSYLCNLLWRKS